MEPSTDSSVAYVFNEATTYKILAKHQNHRVIFSNEEFNDPRIPSRDEAQRNIEAIEETFTQLGFRVETHRNLCRDELLAGAKRMARAITDEVDCFVCFILTHGGERGLWARDQRYSFKELASSFGSEECPALDGKPKIFFLEVKDHKFKSFGRLTNHES